jgi:cytochrome c551/c552
LTYRILLALAAASCVPVSLPEGAARNAAALAEERGCHTCHAEKALPLDSGRVPIAPAWPEIAARYRRDPGAGEALEAVLVGGTVERHWKGEPLVSMLPQEKWVAPGEARILVRWILGH